MDHRSRSGTFLDPELYLNHSIPTSRLCVRVLQDHRHNTASSRLPTWEDFEQLCMRHHSKGLYRTVWFHNGLLGFLIFGTMRDAMDAKESLHGRTVGNIKLSVSYAKVNTHLWLGRVPRQLTREKLHAMFVKFGKLEDVRTPGNKEYAFVDFKNENDAIDAVKSITRQILRGDVLRDMVIDFDSKGEEPDATGKYDIIAGPFAARPDHSHSRSRDTPPSFSRSSGSSISDSRRSRTTREESSPERRSRDERRRGRTPTRSERRHQDGERSADGHRERRESRSARESKRERSPSPVPAVPAPIPAPTNTTVTATAEEPDQKRRKSQSPVSSPPSRSHSRSPSIPHSQRGTSISRSRSKSPSRSRSRSASKQRSPSVESTTSRQSGTQPKTTTNNVDEPADDAASVTSAATPPANDNDETENDNPEKHEVASKKPAHIGTTNPQQEKQQQQQQQQQQQSLPSPALRSTSPSFSSSPSSSVGQFTPTHNGSSRSNNGTTAPMVTTGGLVSSPAFTGAGELWNIIVEVPNAKRKLRVPVQSNETIAALCKKIGVRAEATLRGRPFILVELANETELYEGDRICEVLFNGSLVRVDLDV